MRDATMKLSNKAIGRDRRNRCVAFSLSVMGLFMMNGHAGLGQTENSNITKATLPKNSVIATVTVASYPTAIVVSPDSKTVYVTNYESKSITVIDAANNYTIKATTAVGNNPEYLTLTPNGNILYVSNAGSGTVSVIDTTKSNYPVPATLTAGLYPKGGNVTPDGKLFAVANLVMVRSTVILSLRMNP